MQNMKMLGAIAFMMLVACSTARPSHAACVPGISQACTCATGAGGAQACRDDGSRFDACECAGLDAEVANDASVSADAWVSADASASDPLNGSWCLPGSGWTDITVWTFANGSFHTMAGGHIPELESFEPGCDILYTQSGTYIENSSSLTLMRDPSTETRSGCASASDNGSGPGSSADGTIVYTFSVSGALFTIIGSSGSTTFSRC